MKRQKQIKWLVAGGIALLGLAGCGGSQESPQNAQPSGKMPVPVPGSNGSNAAQGAASDTKAPGK